MSRSEFQRTAVAVALIMIAATAAAALLSVLLVR